MAAAAIYARISSDRTGAGLGVDRQEEDCRALCERNGWLVVEVWRDNDVSAYSGKPRPGYTAMMAALREGSIDTIVCWHPDRLHRSPRELEDFITAVEAARATVISVTSGDLDLSTPEGRLTARVVGAVARKESEDKSRRMKRKHRQLAEAGEWAGGGTRPFGYAADRLTVRIDEAALIREASQRILEGDRLRSIAADWNRRGVPTVSGGQWTTIVLRRVLTSARTAGWREHAGVWTAAASWPGILDRPTVERLRLVLLDPARRVAVTPRRYLLTGIARCGLCDARLVARPRADKRRCYVCATGPNFAGCGKIRALSDPVEQWVALRLFAWLDSDALAASRADAGPPPDVLATIAADEAALEQLARDHYVDRVIGRSEYLAARKGLEARLAASRRLVVRRESDGRLGRLTGTGGALAERWEGMTFDARRAVVEVCVESVVIGPAVPGRNVFDPERISLSWRQ